MTKHQFKVSEKDADKRLDNYISEKLPHLSRTYIQKLITDKYVKINSQIEKKKYSTKLNDLIEIIIPEIRELELEAENISLDIIYEDTYLLVVNKPKGMVVHPAPGNYTGTLVNALLAKGIELSGINGIMRPGIVHRLDKDTSGLLIVAKNDLAHKNLSKQLEARNITRKYKALVHDNVPVEKGSINAPIGRDALDRKKMTVTTKNSKKAVTHFTVIERFKNYTLLELKLDTGRTHQIRVHMSYIKHPIVGDKQYGRKNNYNFQGQALHAYNLGFKHPKTDDDLNFKIELPDEFENFLNYLRNREAN